MTVGFIGTGLLAAGMIKCLRRREVAVRAWNRTRSKAEALAPLGVEVADTPADAVAGCDRVHIVLTADEAVDAQLAAIADALGDGAVVIDHSTTSAEGTVARAAWCAERGIAFLHCPVFMSPAACEAAKGWMLAGGPADAYARVEEELSQMTGDVRHVGDAKQSAALKLIGNGMVLAMVGATADLFRMGEGMGVEPGKVIDLFGWFNPNAVLQVRGRNMSEGHYDTAWALAMARKDVTLMQAGAGAPLPVLDAVAARMEALIDRGHADLDVGVMAIDSVPPRGEG